MTNWFNEADDAPTPWTLAEIYADLGGRADICKTLDVGLWRVESWFARRAEVHCPLPIKRIGNTDVYSMQEWKDWYATWLNKHRPGTKWTDEAQPHGSGQPFFTYDRD